MFAKNDRVFDVRLGFGAVTSVGHFDGFPVKVEFENGQRNRYSHEGMLTINSAYPSLFSDTHPIADMMKEAARTARAEKIMREHEE